MQKQPSSIVTEKGDAAPPQHTKPIDTEPLPTTQQQQPTTPLANNNQQQLTTNNTTSEQNRSSGSKKSKTTAERLRRSGASDSRENDSAAGQQTATTKIEQTQPGKSAANANATTNRRSDSAASLRTIKDKNDRSSSASSSASLRSANIPKFYFPNGRPVSQEDREAQHKSIKELFSKFEGQRAKKTNMLQVVKVSDDFNSEFCQVLGCTCNWG